MECAINPIISSQSLQTLSGWVAEACSRTPSGGREHRVHDVELRRQGRANYDLDVVLGVRGGSGSFRDFIKIIISAHLQYLSALRVSYQ